MAQTTSTLWKTLLRQSGTVREYKFEINGVEYTEDDIIDHAASSGLYEKFSFGNAACAVLDLTLYADDIPRGATIHRYVRLRNGDQVSEWLSRGVFYISRRSHDDGVWTVQAYDAMRKADRIWTPSQDLAFPMPMPDAVELFCEEMGVELDPRTTLNAAYTIDYPANDYTIRDVLRFIAAAHGGNWVMSDAGQLLLVPLLSAPTETNHLVTEHGDAIVLGGVRILVR